MRSTSLRVTFYTFIFFLTASLLGCGSSEENQSSESNTASHAVPAPEEKAQPGTPQKSSSQANILVLGNSISAGYGLTLEQAFPFLIKKKIDSLGLSYEVINAGLSGETTEAGVNRLPWLLRQPISILVIELGGNDGLRGIPAAETEANLIEMVQLARDKYPNIQIIVCGMLAPPNMGQAYTQAFQQTFAKVAESEETYLLPFILDGVAGIPSLNQEDGIHPTPQGQEIVANNLWKVLQPLL